MSIWESKRKPRLEATKQSGNNDKNTKIENESLVETNRTWVLDFEKIEKKESRKTWGRERMNSDLMVSNQHYF